MDTRDLTVIADQPLRARVSWGAIFAGLFFVLALGWLMALLGTALGVSVADATDMEAAGAGFGWGAAIWLIGSFVVAYFVGGWIVTRLAGEPSKTRGMLYGLTLWGVATVVTAVLGYMGISGLLSAGSAVVSGTANVASQVVSGGASVAQGAWEQGSELMDSQLMDRARETMEEEIARAIGETSGPRLFQQDVERALQGLDQGVLSQAAGQLLDGDTAGARRTLREATGLSQNEVGSLVEGISQEIETTWNESQVAQAVEASFRDGLSSMTSSVAAAGGESLTEEEVRTAFDQLDGALLADIAGELIAGRPEAAKRVLRRETTLEREDIDSLVSSASTTIDETVQSFQDQASAAVEATSSYAQQVLWWLTISVLVALIAATLGGAYGARRLREHYTVGGSPRSPSTAH